jgi:hypothetical protein
MCLETASHRGPLARYSAAFASKRSHHLIFGFFGQYIQNCFTSGLLTGGEGRIVQRFALDRL